MISYTNTFKVNILDPLEGLLSNEFGGAIHYDEEFNIRGSQWFNLSPLADSLVEEKVQSQLRDYSVQIRYYRHSSGQKTKNTHVSPVMEIGERLKRLIKNNSHYTDSGTYLWHDGRIDSITYNIIEDDVSPDYVIVEANFIATVEEVMS